MWCSALEWGGGGTEAEEMKSIFCNPKNAAKFKDPSDNTVIVFFSCTDSIQRQDERCMCSKLKHARKAMKMRDATHFI